MPIRLNAFMPPFGILTRRTMAERSATPASEPSTPAFANAMTIAVTESSELPVVAATPPAYLNDSEMSFMDATVDTAA
ncbi:hypothetical protein ACVIU7_005345 [Bradyrhizobium liaoningense]